MNDTGDGFFVLMVTLVMFGLAVVGFTCYQSGVRVTRQEAVLAGAAVWGSDASSGKPVVYWWSGSNWVSRSGSTIHK